MIVQNTLTLCDRSVKCGSGSMQFDTLPTPPWAINFRVTRDQPELGSILHKREEPGNEVDFKATEYVHGWGVWGGGGEVCTPPNGV